ncbi:MAG: hypothetical protein KME42_05585 [Tildeniella nuda ZEHNDER 1965/U140]|jgi:hypothetical protein|nr:hypothetical protein [Tildeniella nuda ZEHNDER 1965/U140]
MTTNPDRHHDDVMSASAVAEASLLLTKLRGGLWNFGSFAWIFALTDRSLAIFAAGDWSAIALAQMFSDRSGGTTTHLCGGWSDRLI